jgi:hypothetical protein
MPRLRAAAGYHDLGMTRQAVCCLDSVLQMDEIGPFALAAEILRTEFLASSPGFSNAAEALEIAACLLPPPADRALLLVLEECDLSEDAE